MSAFQRFCHSWLILLLLSVGVDAVGQRRTNSQDSLAGVQGNAVQAVYQGSCGSFVSQCYKTCFALGQIRIDYTCSLSQGIYSAHCGCGPTDETNVVLALVGIPTTSTKTVQTTATVVQALTATSTASTTTTTTATVQTSVCSYATVSSTVLVTTTITAQPTTVTSLTVTTVTTSAAAAGVFTTAVPAVIVSSGTLSKRKRGALASNSFCNDIQTACTLGCAAAWSSPAVEYCQANAPGLQFSIACICKNNINVVQQVIQAFNLLKPASQKCTSIATTNVAATAVATATSVATVIITSKTTVVPTTVVSVYTSIVTGTSTYACYTTVLASSIITNSATPTVITTYTSTSTTTSVTAIATSLFYVAVATAGQATPSYVAQSLGSDHFAQTVSGTESAQIFAILQDTSSDALYNLVGVGTGVFQGLSLGAQTFVGDDPTQSDLFYLYLLPRAVQAQGPAKYTGYTNYGAITSFETAIWQINLFSLASQIVWTSPSGANPPTADLQGFVHGAEIGACSDFDAFTAKFDSGLDPAVFFTLVPV